MKHLTPNQMWGVSLVIGLAIVAALTVLAGLVYDAVVEKDGIAGLDQPALDLAISTRSSIGNDVATAYTNVGGTIGMPILATVVALGLAFRWRQWAPITLIAATAVGSVSLTLIGKAVVGRSRPPLNEAVPPYEPGASFPSGHSLSSVALGGIVVYLLIRRQERLVTRTLTVVVGGLFALTMGLTRVYLGQHWLTDVLAAWMVGLAWLAVVITAHRLVLTVRRRSELAAPEGSP